MVAAEDDGKTRRATCATAFEIWSNVFSMFAGIVKTSPASHLCGAGGCAA